MKSLWIKAYRDIKVLNLLNRYYSIKVVPGDGLEPSRSMSEGF